MPAIPGRSSLRWLPLCAAIALIGRAGPLSAAKTESTPTIGVAYSVAGAHVSDKAPTPEGVEQQAVTVSDGHRIEAGRYLTVMVADSYGDSSYQLAWLSLEFKDQGAAVTYTLPHKDVRAFYSSWDLKANEEAYSEEIKGAVTLDDNEQLLTVDLAIPLVTTEQPAQRSERHVTGKYFYHKAVLAELKWPWGSR